MRNFIIPKKFIVSSQGYYFIKFPSHRRANGQGYVKYADLILEEKLGRRLKSNEVAHHIDGNRGHDFPENLQVMPKKLHDGLHAKERCRARTLGFQSGEKHFKWANIPKKKVIALYKKGKSFREIGRLFRVDHQTISRHLRHWKIII